MPSWAPGVYRPATADPSAVKSAFLFDKRSRCDPISVLQMPRFPVMLFPLCFFLLPLSPPLSLYLSLFILSFFKLLYLSFQACLDNCVVTLHSPFFLSIIHHCGQQLRPVVHRQPAHISSHATAHIARPAPAPAPILLPLGTSNPPPPILTHPSIRIHRSAPQTPAGPYILRS